MKKLIMIVAVLAIAFAFLPKAEAADSAELGLSVTFALEPLQLLTDPAGPFTVDVGQKLRFTLTALDNDAAKVMLNDFHPDLPQWVYLISESVASNAIKLLFECRPMDENVGEYHIPFTAKNDSGEEVSIIVDITVPKPKIISIELEPTTWELKGVKLGEKRENLNEFGATMHKIFNRGNVDVLVDIKYISQVQIPENPPPLEPGLEQGKNTFITELLDPFDHSLKGVLPPNGGIQVGHIGPTEGLPLPLVYGAPTALSKGIKDHGVKYELRAYGDIIIKSSK